MLKPKFVSCIFLLTALTASAAAVAADPVAGKARAAVCQGCHGADGVSALAKTPSLAGQPAAYLEAQLQKFKSGLRKNPTMQAMVSELSNSDIENLAAFFAALPAKSAGGDPQLASAGKAKTAMCVSCHGENLGGHGEHPRLAGQRADYLVEQLQKFKQRERQGGPMNAIAQLQSADDINALAAYLAGLN